MINIDLTGSISSYAEDRWWMRADPSKLRLVDGDAGFWSALRDIGGSLLVTSRNQDAAITISGIGDGGIASVSAVTGPMGAAISGSALAVGTRDGIRVYQNVADSSAEEAIYVAAAFHYTGRTSVHEVGWDREGRLWFANTAFSALCTIEQTVPFCVRWRPSFVQEFIPRDCCHLNGFAMRNGAPAYVTALGASGTPDGWRKTSPDGGLILSVDQGVLASGLSLPHSPVVLDNAIFFLESGKGRISKLGLQDGKIEEIFRFSGVARGFACTDNAWFVGLSRVRNSSGDVADHVRGTAGDIDSAKIVAIDPKSGKPVGQATIPFLGEISSITCLPSPKCRIAEPTVADLKNSWIFATDEKMDFYLS
jgi:uncharacterized protein (TIGR03032 family)